MRTALLLALLLAAAPAFADTIRLNTGRVLEGTIVEEAPDSIVVRTASGVRATIPLDTVLEIVRGKTTAQVLEDKIAALQTAGPREHHRLVAECEAAGLTRQAKRIHELVLKRWPDDALARKALGYVRHQGEWLTRPEYMASLGLVPRDGSWVSQEEAARRDRADAAKGERPAVERALRAAALGKADALATLRAFDDAAAVPVLERKTRAQTATTRLLAIAELGRRKAQRAELALARAAVDDTQGKVRKAALAALGELPSTKDAAGYFLRSVTRQAHPFKRVHAVQAVGAYPGPGAVPALITVLRESTSNFGRASISVITQRAYIQDFELSSGGTGNIVAEVADPVIGGFTEGVTLDMKVTKWERVSVVQSLRRVTGQSFGAKPAAWQRWWEKNR